MNRAAGLGRGSTSPSLIAHPLSTGSETLQHQHSSSSSSPQSVVEPCFDYSKAAQLSMAANSHATPPPNPLIIDMPQLLLECGLAARYRTAFPPTLSLEELHNLTKADLRIKFGVKSVDDCRRLLEAVEAFDEASMFRCGSECGSACSVPLSPEIRRVGLSEPPQHHPEPSLLTLYHSARWVQISVWYMLIHLPMPWRCSQFF